MSTATLYERASLYNNSYGSAKRISKAHLRAAAVVFCVATPFTNWLIPFLSRIIKNDLVVRYE